MKRLIAIILSMTLLVGLLAGCNGGATSSAASSTATSTSASASVSAKPVSISLWVMPLYEAFIDDLKATYPAAITKAYPNITLAPELLSWDAGPEKLTVAMATGATPDFMNDVYARLAPGIDAKLCVDISDVITAEKDVIMAGFQTIGKVDGKNYYAATMTNNGYNFAVNIDLAKELGVFSLLPADKIHWSYDQFLDFCRKATAAGKSKSIYATQLWAGSRSSDAAYYSFLMTGGTEITNKDLTACTANSATAEASLAVLKTLITEKLVPDGAATTKDEAVNPNFEGGKLVMNLAAAGAQTPITIYNKAKKGDIKGFACDFYQMPSPTGKTDPKVASFGTQGFVAFTNKNDADKIAATKNAIKVWYTTDLCGKVVKNSGVAPAVTNVTIDYGDATLNEQAKRAYEFNAKYATSDFGILKGWWTSFRETFYVQLQAYYTGTKTAKQALADWQTNATAAIVKANTATSSKK